MVFYRALSALAESKGLRDRGGTKQIVLRYATLYNEHLPQAALNSQTPMNAMRMWRASHPQIFKFEPGLNRPGCDR
jgi:hypothetical protein